MSGLMEWAKDELKLWNAGERDRFGEVMSNDALEVLGVLCNQGHSGISAPIIMSMIQRLWSWKPLTPLTGQDDEWTDKLDPDGNTLMNIRCPAVFKNKETGKAFYLDGRVFVEPDGATFTCNLSSVDIDFPFTVPDNPMYVYLKYSTRDKDVDEQWHDGDYEIKEG